MDTCHADKSRTAGAILLYLHDHPEGQDTAESIAAWWRSERKIELPPNFLKEVLSDLVTQGLLEAQRDETGIDHYYSRRRR